MSDFMQKVVDFARSKVGLGYIYGATGWICSKARREQQAAQYPDQYNNIMVVGAKWDGVQCYDCAQLTRWAADAAGGYLPSGANAQWTGSYWQQKGAIEAMPKDQTCFLYRIRDGKAQHTGIYTGDGYVVDARGAGEGIIRTKLESYPWTHYAVHTMAGETTGGQENMKPPYKAVVKTKTGGGVWMWSDNVKTAKIQFIPEGAEVGVVTEKDAKGFVCAEYAKQVNYVDAKYLVPIAGSESGQPGEEAGDDHILTVSKCELEHLYELVTGAQAFAGDALAKGAATALAEAQEMLSGLLGVWG